MTRAILIADGRPNDKQSVLGKIETQRLIEQYPNVVCRHFMVRVKARMKFITSKYEVFGGKVRDVTSTSHLLTSFSDLLLNVMGLCFSLVRNDSMLFNKTKR